MMITLNLIHELCSQCNKQTEWWCSKNFEIKMTIQQVRVCHPWSQQSTFIVTVFQCIPIRHILSYDKEIQVVKGFFFRNWQKRTWKCILFVSLKGCVHPRGQNKTGLTCIILLPLKGSTCTVYLPGSISNYI